MHISDESEEEEKDEKTNEPEEREALEKDENQMDGDEKIESTEKSNDDDEEEEDAFRPVSSVHILELSPMYLFQDRSFSSMVKASSRQSGRKREPHDAAFGPPALDGSSLSPVSKSLQDERRSLEEREGQAPGKEFLPLFPLVCRLATIQKPCPK